MFLIDFMENRLGLRKVKPFLLTFFPIDEVYALSREKGNQVMCTYCVLGTGVQGESDTVPALRQGPDWDITRW